MRFPRRQFIASLVSLLLVPFTHKQNKAEPKLPKPGGTRIPPETVWKKRPNNRDVLLEALLKADLQYGNRVRR